MLTSLLIAALVIQSASQVPAQSFTEAVVQSVSSEWRNVQTTRGKRFQPPRVVFLNMPLAHPGGGSGYDRRVGLVIDLADVERVRTAFGDDGDDLAALMIAHEYGHYLQDISGVSAAMPAGPERERQADCYSGWWWGRQMTRQGKSLRLDLDRRFPELLRLMSISRTGSLTAESNAATHGDPGARVEAIRLGLAATRPEVCGL